MEPTRLTGMTSATLETDAAGTLVGSSNLYATAREGVWKGRKILPRGYVAMMASPVAASGGEYGRGLVWRWATHGDTPGDSYDAASGLPSDTFWLVGHDGQYVAIIPSRESVIVRLGVTPAREHYHPQPLVLAVLEAIR